MRELVSDRLVNVSQSHPSQERRPGTLCETSTRAVLAMQVMQAFLILEDGVRVHEFLGGATYETWRP